MPGHISNVHPNHNHALVLSRRIDWNPGCGSISNETDISTICEMDDHTSLYMCRFPIHENIPFFHFFPRVFHEINHPAIGICSQPGQPWLAAARQVTPSSADDQLYGAQKPRRGTVARWCVVSHSNPPKRRKNLS